MTELRFEITLRTMEALPRILMLAARLGGRVRLMLAQDNHVLFEMDADDSLAHRIGPQLDRLVDVLVLRSLGKGDATESFKSERLDDVYTV